MANVWIRRYRPEDQSAVMALAPRLVIGVAPWRDADGVRRAVTGWVRDSLDGFDREYRAVLVADGERGLVGVATLGSRQHFSGETDAYVGELIVAEAEEGRGIGTLLMQAAEDWAKSQGFRHLTLETGAANSVARAFYASLGYLEEEVRLTKSMPTDPVEASR